MEAQEWPKFSAKAGLILLIIAVAFVFLIQSWCADKELEKAKAAEDQVKLLKDELQALREEMVTQSHKHDADRAQWAAQTEGLMRGMSSQNQATQRLVAGVLAHKTIDEVKSDAKGILGVEPKITPDGMALITIEQLQGFSATKLSEMQLQRDKETLLAVVENEKRVSQSLRDDLTLERKLSEKKDQIIEMQVVAIDGYKAKAIQTRKQKVLSFVGKAAWVGFAVLLASAVN